MTWLLVYAKWYWLVMGATYTNRAIRDVLRVVHFVGPLVEFRMRQRQGVRGGAEHSRYVPEQCFKIIRPRKAGNRLLRRVLSLLRRRARATSRSSKRNKSHILSMTYTNFMHYHWPSYGL